MNTKNTHIACRIGVFGSAVSESPDLEEKAAALGRVLATQPVSLVTGACEGLPNTVVTVAKHVNPLLSVYGYSSFKTMAEQQQGSHADVSAYTAITYIPETFAYADSVDVCRKYRNVLSTASCEGGIILSGRWGTLNEFTNLIDMGKVIGVLTGTGGIADELAVLQTKISKPTKAILFFSSSPQELVGKVMNEVGKRMTQNK